MSPVYPSGCVQGCTSGLRGSISGWPRDTGRASQVALVVKNPPANAENVRDAGSIPGVGKIPWRRAWQSALVFLPGESHGQRSLEGYSPWGCKELDRTEAT